MSVPSRRGAASPLLFFLAFVILLFVGVLVFVYVEAEKAKPVILDEHGRPRAALFTTPGFHA